ncbi:hypothetical protein AMTRI_Chr01g104750 [Amborella trichopoda]
MRLCFYLIKTRQGTGLLIHICLLQMYVKCGSLLDDHWHFDQMLQKQSLNTVLFTLTWNSIIHDLAKCGQLVEALAPFHSILEWEPFSFNALMNRFFYDGQPKEALCLSRVSPRYGPEK